MQWNEQRHYNNNHNHNNLGFRPKVESIGLPFCIVLYTKLIKEHIVLILTLFFYDYIKNLFSRHLPKINEVL